MFVMAGVRYTEVPMYLITPTYYNLLVVGSVESDSLLQTPVKVKAMFFSERNQNRVLENAQLYKVNASTLASYL